MSQRGTTSNRNIHGEACIHVLQQSLHLPVGLEGLVILPTWHLYLQHEQGLLHLSDCSINVH